MIILCWDALNEFVQDSRQIPLVKIIMKLRSSHFTHFKWEDINKNIVSVGNGLDLKKWEFHPDWN